MYDVSIKTLDGQNKTFNVEEEITVAQFKEKIAGSIDIAADTQRLIFHGRVLQDDKILKDYGVQEKVVHVVQRPPPSSLASTHTSTASASSSSSSDGGGGPSSNARHHRIHHLHALGPNLQSFVVGSFTLPPNILHPAQLVPARASQANVDGGSLNVHIDMGPHGPPATSTSGQQGGEQSAAQPSGSGPSGGGRSNTSPSEAAQRLAQARRNLGLAEGALSVLQNPRNRLEEIPSGPFQSSTSTSQATAAPSSSADPVTTAAQSPSNANANREARPRELASVLRQVESVHQSLSPYIRQVCRLAENDPTIRPQDVRQYQSLVDHVSEALHALSHSYHNLSDIAYTLAPPPPRSLQAQALPIYQQHHPPAVVFSQPMNMPHPGPQQAPPQANGTQNNNATPRSQAPPPSAPSHAHMDSAFTSQATPTSTPVLSSTSGSSAVSSAAEGVAPATEGSGGAESDPYVFVEVGPDSVTVNSISTTVVVSEEMESDMEADSPHGVQTTQASSTETPTVSAAATTSSSSPSAPSTTTASTGGPGGQAANFQGFSSIPGVPADLMNSIVQSVLQAHGEAQPHGVRQGEHQVQVNVVPVQMPVEVPVEVPVDPSAMPIPIPVTSGSLPMGVVMQQAMQAAMGSMPGVGIHTHAPAPAPNAATTTASSAPPPASSSAPAASTAAPTVSQATGPSAQQAGVGFQPPRPQQPRAPGAVGGPGNVFARIPIFRQRAPVPGFLPMPLMQPTDIYLPCFSPHFIGNSTIDRMAQRMQGVPGTQNLGSMMAGMMSTLFGQPRPRGPPVSERSSQQPGGTPQRSANETTTRAETSTTATQQGSISANPFATLFSHILRSSGPLGQLAATPPGTAAAPPATGESGPEGSGGGMSDAVFAHLVQGVRSQASQAMAGNQSGQTVAAFLQTLGDNHSIVPGEGFLTDAFLCVAEQLTFADMITIFMGQHQPIARLRRPLRQFVSDRVLHGSGITDDNLQRATGQVVEELVPDIQSIVADAPIQEDINLDATLRKFLSHHLLALFKLIVSFNVSDEDFGRQFYTDFRRLLAEFMVLMPACLQGGQQSFTTVISNRLAVMLAGLNPMLQQWMTSITLEHVSSFQRSLAVTPATVHAFIVRHPPSSTPAPSAPRAPAATETRQAVRSESPEAPMEVNDARASPPPKPAAAASAPVPTTAARAPRTLDLPRRGERDARSRPGAVQGEGRVVNGHNSTPTASVTAVTSPGSGPTNWQDVVPSDWVPVMEADIQKQKSQRPQAPFSDAYLQGLPPKRRRLMSYDQAASMSNMTDYLPAAVKRAAGRVGAEPVSSPDNLVAEATDEQELQGMLDRELNRSLSRRLEHDGDFSAERFPSAQRYFKPKPS